MVFFLAIFLWLLFEDILWVLCMDVFEVAAWPHRPKRLPGR